MPMKAEDLALLGIQVLVNLLIELIQGGQGNSQSALDIAEELARRIAFEEAQRAKPSLWRKLFGGKRA